LISNYKIKIIYLLLIFNSSLLYNCVGYLGHLALGQSQIILDRQRISDLLNSETDSLIRKKLELIPGAKQFAVDKLALNSEGGYEYFTKLKREEVGWHVTASYPLKFDSYTWWFPIVGSVPYKGYFDLEKAREEEKSLIEMGLDTRVRITAGYSTLGWFSDPLLSPQLKLRDDELIALVFHEMAHATIYFNGDSKFNESYASFIEDLGTEMYYKSMNSEESLSILDKRMKAKQERKIIFNTVKLYGERLKDLYDSDKTDEEKLVNKNRTIEDFRKDIIEKSNQFKIVDTRNLKTAKINNETFLSVLRYNSGEEFFNALFQKSNKNINVFQNEVMKLKSLSKEERQNLLK
jgi:predicted aminopeptidase